jgi:hypothetical protein
LLFNTGQPLSGIHNIDQLRSGWINLYTQRFELFGGVGRDCAACEYG